MAEDPELEDLLGSVEASANQTNKDDAELSQLLDSALKDFTPSQTESKGESAGAAAGTAGVSGASSQGPSGAGEGDFSHLEDLLKGRCRYGKVLAIPYIIPSLFP